MGRKINRTAKHMVIASLLGTILLVIGAILYLYSIAKSNPEGYEGTLFSPQGGIILTIIVLGIISFLFTIYKNMKRDKNIENLNEEYSLVFEEVGQYIGVSGLTHIEKKELKNEILSLFLEAQKNGKDVKKVIGKDYKGFIDNMIQAYGIKNYLIYDLLTGLQYFIFYIVAIQFMLFFEKSKEGFGFYQIKIDYPLILFFVLSAFVLIPLIQKGKRRILLANNKRKGGFSLYFLLMSAFTLGTFIATIVILGKYFHHITWVDSFLNDGLVIIHSPILLGVFLFLIIILYLVKKRIRSFQ